MSRKKWPRYLADWYKPTKRGEKARKFLIEHAGEQLAISGEIGAVAADEKANVDTAVPEEKKKKT